MTIERNTTMSNHDLDWLVSQQPEEPALDPGARERALRALVQHTSSAQRDRGSSLGDLVRARRFGIPALTGNRRPRRRGGRVRQRRRPRSDHARYVHAQAMRCTRARIGPVSVHRWCAWRTM